MTAPPAILVPAEDLSALVSRIFMASGLAEAAASTVAAGLVQADLDGLPSHGVLLVDLYVARLRSGSVTTAEAGTVVSERGACVVLDAGHALGHLTGDQSIDIAVARAKQHGIGAVAVRHGFHFGTARRYAERAADQGCIGIAMCNTRPLMPPPGGAERTVGNNPIAIAVPSAEPIPLVLDMATSEAAMGKIRLAEKAGQPIPATWAVQNDGSPTTDPAQAIAGMLLPASGPKGFGLAVMIDLMSGLLSGGASGQGVNPLYGDPAIPYDCSHFFMAIDVAHFCDLSWFRAQAASAAQKIRGGQRAPGVAQLYAPGEPEWRRRQSANRRVKLDRAVARTLVSVAESLRISAGPLLALANRHSGEKQDAEA
jgi:LDH2 family malate/lactate/ureidoglycolate dehydrogenase